MQHDEKTHVSVDVRSAGVVILDPDERILLVREKTSYKAHLWHVPAGRVEAGEPLESAALREAKEETGLDVRLLCYLNTYIGRFESGDLIARHVWLAEPIDKQEPAPLLSEEVAECRYFTKAEFDAFYKQKRIRMYHTKLIFEEALAFGEVY